jgi:hypothetical protein
MYDPKYLISCSSEYIILVWDITVQKLICRLQGHTD